MAEPGNEETVSKGILSIKTHYESKFMEKGMKINYLAFRLEKEKTIRHGWEKKNENDFFERVYEVTRLIPYGRVTSYGAIARFLGSGRSARMVGWALNVTIVTRIYTCPQGSEPERPPYRETSFR